MLDKNGKTLPSDFPAWFYGPDGQKDVFENKGDVPNGWSDHPSKVNGGDVPEPQQTGGAPAGGDPNVELDANGTPWNENVNMPDRSKTNAGLWTLKPGQSRPAPTEGYPKAAFQNL